MMCCNKSNHVHKVKLIEEDGFTFAVTINYCSGCGVVLSNSSIKDGRKNEKLPR